MLRYFISDLHLSEKRPDLTRAFTLLIDQIKHSECQQATEFYILGDFYEAWIGDDHNPDWNHPIMSSLSSLRDSNINLFVMHGNRDFLLGERWAESVGARLIPEQTIIHSSNSSSILLSHGDEYCIEDVEYQAFRKQVRQQEWQDHVLGLPLEHRIALAEQLRNDSKSMSAEKNNDIMDVTKSEIAATLKKLNCNHCIHGHTHKPRLHTDEYNRLVLGDWDDFVWLAVLHNNELTQYRLPINLIATSQSWHKTHLEKIHSLHLN
ncbi:UDP-2,3-diacylglucosamine diphosphatase [Marinomonas sp. 2405UD68-3]|uniref:UDP-2,3-diacylglucosamine diphosphatase n=1 Tax=Marinomonas sp. 2405UD68-3 TaxID=3391835 RepID=UPI0039C95137